MYYKENILDNIVLLKYLLNIVTLKTLNKWISYDPVIKYSSFRAPVYLKWVLPQKVSSRTTLQESLNQ